MDVKFKKLTATARDPFRKHPSDAGIDLSIDSWAYDTEQQILTIGTGIAMEIPEGHVGLIFPRSSIYKTKCRLSNCVGVIDSNYRGEINAKFDVPPTATLGLVYRLGERCMQLIIMPYPQINYVEADELSDTDRDTGGYGSTGK